MGRHREFNTEEALDAALLVFWRKGFDGTSLSDLTAATGVAAPGLYSAFGNKEAFFLKVLDRYESMVTGFMTEVLQAPTARAVVEKLLLGNAELLSDPSHPPGCLGVNGALACSDEAEPVRQELVRRRMASEAVLRERFNQARESGDLLGSLTPEDLARYVMTVIQGMAIQAKSGATRTELLRVAELALHALPEPVR
jgi:AcrR family transcriptional regulator